ncbi:Yip1 family protein [Streptomyces yaizuensis]|uniref:Yip1 family protein n=1 Tax=Streptomyces yaizuensis TaxID=2989713 RepID=UPI002B205E84|nr:Yip1 family protein [Streptomyces sp. YSPA8]
MAGFRIGRGRDNNRTQQQRPQQAPPGYGGGQQAVPPHAQRQQPARWPQSGQPGQPGPGGHPGHAAPRGHGGGYQGPHGEPEYFGEPDPYQQQRRPQPHHPQQQPYPYEQQHPQQQPGPGAGRQDPYANNPGHTQAFSVPDPYGEGAVYQAGSADGPPAGPRLPWKQLLSGIVLRPTATFWQMRDYAVWGPALAVTFLYGALALFGFDQARDETINATISAAIPYVLTTGVAFVIGGLIMGAVTHTLGRQLGGNGAWQPTVGLSMLIMSITDAPRLLFAMFLGGENAFVQILGWATWLGAGALFTLMMSRSHDLPWPKALGASAIQLIALLSIIKLGTI